MAALLGTTIAPVQHANDPGVLHHPIDTDNRDAQRFFDRGLTYLYGFNRDAARRAFAQAAGLDPRAAMPQVGIALASGPNLNMDADAMQIRDACAASRRALALSRGAGERGYSSAVVARYCGADGSIDAAAYADAMSGVRNTRRDDPDASVLYADSLMQLRPRTPQQDAEIVTVLESVIHDHPSHVGANHYYVHAVEGSANPTRAIESARRLETLVPDIGHLLHMPSHVYMRTGDYSAAIATNVRAAAADLAYLRENPPGHDGAMYYLHDLESLAVANGFAGRFDDARTAANEIARVEAGLADSSPDRHFSAPLALVLLRFAKWAAVVALPAPPPADVLGSMMSRFARADALFALNRIADGSRERDAFEEAARATPDTVYYRSNPIERIREVFRAVLAARCEQSMHGAEAAIDAWQRAVAAQDRLAYHEPPPFYYPVRESLGAALLAAGRYDEAERVFREDLEVNPGNGRSLFGLMHALRARGRTDGAHRARELFMKAWTHADVTLSLSSF